MSSFWLHQNETFIEVPSSEEINNVTYYKIVVKVGEITWHVKHRYSEFYEMHSRVVIDHGVSKDILPSKKVIRNKCPLFIENRRKGLDEYCHKLLNYLKRTMPRTFVEFFDFHLYDIFYKMQNLAIKYFLEAEILLATDVKHHTLTPIELHAVSDCLKKPVPVIPGNLYDFTHVLEFYSRLHSLTVSGSNNCYVRSNIVPNTLPIELTCFKELKSVTLKKVSLDKILSIGNLRTTVERLFVHHTSAASISEVLQCDVLHKNNLDLSQVWKTVTHMDLSRNSIVEIDVTINLVPHLESLILDSNQISKISDLSHLHSLSRLVVSNNAITACDSLHTKMGKILSLNLSQNSITTLNAFQKLYSLVTLDLSCNRIQSIDEIAHIGKLPCLENLMLTGNPVATTVDYRCKVLQYFKDRAKDICLDNERPSQNEIDKVSVLRALQIVKDGEMPDLTYNVYT